MTRLGYLMLAYNITWLVIFGYMLTVSRRQTRLSEEIAQLQAAVTRLSAGR